MLEYWSIYWHTDVYVLRMVCKSRVEKPFMFDLMIFSPTSIHATWIDAGPEQFTAGEIYSLVVQLSTSLTPVRVSKFSDIHHINGHQCQTKLGACVPSITVTPGLVTQTPVQWKNLTSGSVQTTISLSLEEGKWTVLAHMSFYTQSVIYSIAM